jgi:hypothetical protein
MAPLIRDRQRGTRERGGPAAAWCEEPTYACGRIRSIVSGLLLTMKTATRTCEPSARVRCGARHLSLPALFRSFPRKRESRAKRSSFGILDPRFRGDERMLHATGTARQASPADEGRRLFCRPGFRAAERCSSGAQSQAAFELQCRLKPGPGHFQQDLPVALRFGVAGPTHALLRELAEFFGGCGHGALYAGDRRERDRSLSHRRLRASCR